MLESVVLKKFSQGIVSFSLTQVGSCVVQPTTPSAQYRTAIGLYRKERPPMKRNQVKSKSVGSKPGHFHTFVYSQICERTYRIWRIASLANTLEESQILYVLYHRLSRFPIEDRDNEVFVMLKLPDTRLLILTGRSHPPSPPVTWQDARNQHVRCNWNCLLFRSSWPSPVVDSRQKQQTWTRYMLRLDNTCWYWYCWPPLVADGRSWRCAWTAWRATRWSCRRRAAPTRRCAASWTASSTCRPSSNACSERVNKPVVPHKHKLHVMTSWG